MTAVAGPVPGDPGLGPGADPGRLGAPPERDWFDRPVLEIACGLLGAVVWTYLPGPGTAPERVALRLTEVEAYDGANDPGSHAYRGRTPRNATMFGPPGHLYVYRHMGLHHCVNVVCGPPGRASAVLLRAGEVVEGADVAAARRTATGVLRREVDLARGPARLAVALGLDRRHDGRDLLSPVTTAEGPPSAGLVLPTLAPTPDRVRTGPRVGVSGPGGDGAVFPWRFWLADEPTVSVYRPGPARRRPT